MRKLLNESSGIERKSYFLIKKVFMLMFVRFEYDEERRGNFVCLFSETHMTSNEAPIDTHLHPSKKQSGKTEEEMH